jgi:general secretion pathway protein A
VSPAAPPGLLDALAAAPAGAAEALLALHRRWRPGEPVPAAEAVRCEEGRVGTLGCVTAAGTWRRLRRLNVPVALELVGPGGERRHAALTGLTEDRVTLELGGRTLTLPIGVVDGHWRGRFSLLWPRPGLPAVPLGPGARGEDVAWMRHRLDALDGRPGEGGDVYDPDLQGRVVAFQRSRGLLPDGLVGLETVTQVAAAVREPGVPWLSPP